MKIKMLRLIIVLLCLSAPGYSQAKDTKKLPIEGQVVDYMAAPIEGAEVAVYEEEYRNQQSIAKMVTPIVRTNQQGHFKLRADVSSQRNNLPKSVEINASLTAEST